MKSILSLLVIISFVSVTASCNSQVRDEKKQEQVAGADIIEVYYFHFTRRCATCNAVENETQIALKEFYPGKIDAGDIVFISINLEEEENDALAKKLEVSGQALLVVKGSQKYDLTNDGFKYARSSPEKLHTSIQTTIDPLL